jgi:magnesium transporter
LIVVVGSTLGAAFPLIGRRLGFDPAVFSAPLITTIVDAGGLLIYFQVARIMMT